MRRLALLLGLLVAPLMWIGAEPAFACSCVSSDVPEFVDRVDAVASGRLVEREYVDDGQDVIYTFAGSERFAGTLTPRFEVWSPASGASCGLEGMVVGRSYVVFLEYQQDGMFTANLCGGTSRATPAYVAGVEAVTGPGTSFSPPRPTDPGSLVLQLLSGWAWWS